jgi:sigma-E factor negative regulatory protein RseA
MLRNPQLDALIAAHNQAGGSSALQMPSGFLRSATFSTDVPVTGLGAK